MTLASKLFLSAVVSWITGRNTHLKIKGTSGEVEIIRGCLQASRDLHNKVSDPEATVEDVIGLLNIKNARASEFLALTGQVWPV